ncbi:MAG: restriction endonuclease subunit S [Verrucomicrobiota bacterium]
MERTNGKQPRYIRITDFGDDGIEPGHKFVTADPVEPDCELGDGDLLFARSGATVGKTYLHEDMSEPSLFAGYCIRFRFRTHLVSPKFVYWFTKTEAYARWVATIQRPAGQPNINKEEFKTVQIPLPAQVADQEKLVAAMEAARTVRRAKLAAAEALLAGLDDFLLATLGLTPPPKDERKVFAVRRTDAERHGHLNADYFHPERILALRAMEAASQRVPCAKLSDVVDFIRDQIKTPGPNYLSLAHIQSNTGELTNSNDEAAGACSEYQTGDVLFARLRPYLNKVYRAEMDGCCSPEFHVLRVNNVNELLPDYLAATLRSSLTLAQTRHMMTGNTHPRLTNEDVINLIIPIPKDVAAQKAIAVEARRRREEARRLRSEAEAGWQAAKRWFEEQLHGPAHPCPSSSSSTNRARTNPS